MWIICKQKKDGESPFSQPEQKNCWKLARQCHKNGIIVPNLIHSVKIKGMRNIFPLAIAFFTCDPDRISEALIYALVDIAPSSKCKNNYNSKQECQFDGTDKMDT
jgi:hypothetical protein